MEVLEVARNLCIDMGGHAQAAGFSISPENIPTFKKKILHIVHEKLSGRVLEPKIVVDAHMDAKAVSIEKIKKLKLLEPCGIGNPEPLFLFKNENIQSTRILGKNGDHLKLSIQGIDTLLFKAESNHFALKPGDTISFVGRLSVNEWHGRISPQILIKQVV